jgi:hypothetical protein
MISRILRLNLKTPQYYYIRTEKELISITDKFVSSEYRYLHLSCHANATGMATTLDQVSFARLAQILKPKLEGRRLFVSTCEMVNDNLARAILPGSGCFSILGPSDKIAFSDAAILWSSFYHLIFNVAADVMKGREIRDVAGKISKLFAVNLRYYWYDDNAKKLKPYNINK